MSTPQPQPSNEQAAKMEERLEELDADIRHARDEQQELDHTDDERRYVDSGDTPQDDDQTIVPPG